MGPARKDNIGRVNREKGDRRDSKERYQRERGINREGQYKKDDREEG